MAISEILNYVFGGGILMLVVGLLTLKAQIRKVNAEAAEAVARAKKAEADAETVKITNAENATRILVDNIVKPLKKELDETHEALQALRKEAATSRRELSRLRKAIQCASDCPYSFSCPILSKLQTNAIVRQSSGSVTDQSNGKGGFDETRNKGDP